jgi:hypothetical protein
MQKEEARMNELEITWSRVIKIWWLLIWRGLLGSTLLGGIVGFIIGFANGIIKAATGVPIPGANLIITVAGVCIGLIWGLAVTRMALRKKYADFRIALVSQ